MLLEDLRQQCRAREAAEAAGDPVAAATAKLETARKELAELEAEIADATALIKHSEKELAAEEERLCENERAVTAAVISRQPLPQTSPSAVDAIKNAITVGRNRLDNAKPNLVWRRDAVARSAAALRVAQSQAIALKLAMVVKANAELIALARSLGAGTFDAPGFRIEREHEGYRTIDPFNRVQTFDTCTIKVSFKDLEAS